MLALYPLQLKTDTKNHYNTHSHIQFNLITKAIIAVINLSREVEEKDCTGALL